MTKLPEWLLKELPHVEEPAVLMYRDNKYVAVAPDGREVVFDEFDKAYDHVDTEWDLEVEFDKSLSKATDEEQDLADLGFIFGKADDKGASRIFASHPDREKLASIEKEYEEFLSLAEKFNKNPDDFETAYRFVDTHPAFWNRPSKDRPWTWMTQGHCGVHNGRLSIDPFFEKDGSYIWKIETGSHVDDDYSGRYYDYRLDAYGCTVEEAYINLAQLIDKFYNFDGTDKEDVPHIKPSWVKELEATIESRTEKG